MLFLDGEYVGPVVSITDLLSEIPHEPEHLSEIRFIGQNNGTWYMYASYSGTAGEWWYEGKWYTLVCPD